MIRIRRRDAGRFEDPRGMLHPLARRVLGARGLRSPEELRYRLADLASPMTLGGIERAVARLERAIADGRRVEVIGDFDADGATGAAVATLGLRRLGARATAHVPHRLRHGYGLDPGFVEELAAREGLRAGDLLLTVDHGTTSLAGVRRARELGLGVIVCDHHLPGPELPAAEALVNPQLPGCAFPSKAIAGVGVAFYLLLALRAKLRERGRFAAGEEPDLRELLDLVALGTVADLVPLDRNNRILVARGLERIRQGRMRPGLAALFAVADRDPATAVAADLAFALAPRLNAAGRLADMAAGLRLLLTEDPGEAEALAAELDAINAERRQRQRATVAEAEGLVEALAREEATLPPALCVSGADWHPGIVGLVASRLKERFHRPTVAFAPDGEGRLRGSARSIPGFHIRDALAAIDAAHPGLIERFGGHAAAAGLSLAPASLAPFAAALEGLAAKELDEERLQREVLTDGELEAEHFAWEAATALEACGPFGQGFPEPLFDGVFECLEARPVGEGHRRLLLAVPGRARPVVALAFDHDADPPPRLRAVYELRPDQWRGRQDVRLLLRHLFPA
ncbi:MAG: single-stranded-DNA-specific exonuclease RecJ [Xanthomonadales bacterium]|nr:single-stranded-DNA-specific exonuclease RecJ [Xanthomonadales bacterium]